MKNINYPAILYYTIAFLLLYAISLEAKETDNPDFKKIDKYLTSLNSIEAKFIQTDAQALKRSGSFYVSKPNKLKISYNDGDREVIMLNDDILILYNTDLDEMNYLANDDIPLSLLSERNFSLSKKAIITHFESDSSSIMVEFALKSDKRRRKIGIFFSKEPMYITKISLGEDDAKVILEFNQPKFNTPINPDIFDIEKARK